MPQSAAADGNAGALERLGQAVKRRAVDIFVTNAKASVEAVAMLPGKGCAGIGARTTGVLMPVRSQ